MPKRQQIEDRGPRSFHYSHYQTRGSRGAALSSIFDAFSSERKETDDSVDESALELQQLLVKLNKRDSVTRQKALDTLLKSLPRISNSAIESKLQDFVIIFKRLVVVEPMKNVRIQIAQLLQAIVKRIGKKMTKHISSLLPWWWIAMHDEAPNVAQAYAEAFKSAFTKNTDPNLLELKVAKVLALYMDDVATTYFYIMTRDQGQFKKDWIDVFGNMCDKPVTLVEMHKRLLTATYESMTGLLEKYRKYSQQPLESTRAASAGAIVNQEFIHLISSVCIKNCPESFRQCRAALKLLIQMVKFVSYENRHITQVCFKIGTESCIAQCHDEHLLLLCMKLVLCCCMYNGDIYNAKATLADLLPRILGHIKGEVSTRIEMYSILAGLMTQLNSATGTMTNGLSRQGNNMGLQRGDEASANGATPTKEHVVQEQAPVSTSPRNLQDYSSVIEGLAQGLTAKMKQHVKEMSYYGSYTFSQAQFQQLGASMLCCYYKLLMQLNTWDSRAASLVCLPLQLLDQETESTIVFLHELPRIFTEFVEDCTALANNINASTLVLQGLQAYEHCVLLVAIYCHLASCALASTPSPMLPSPKIGNIIKDAVNSKLPDLLDILYSHTLPQLVKDLINDCNNKLVQMKIDQALDLCKTNHVPRDKFACLSALPKLLSQAKLELKDFQICYSFLLKIFSSLPLSGDVIATDTLTSACIAAVCCNTNAVAASKLHTSVGFQGTGEGVVDSSGSANCNAGSARFLKETATVADASAAGNNDSCTKRSRDEQRIELARSILVQRPTSLSDPLAIHVAQDFLDRCGASIACALSNEMIDFCHGGTLDQSLALTVLEHVDPNVLDAKHKGSLYILYMALRLTKSTVMDVAIDWAGSRVSGVNDKFNDLVPCNVVNDLACLYFCGIVLKCNMDFNLFVKAAEAMYDYRLNDLDAYSVAVAGETETMAITSEDVERAFNNVFPLDNEPIQFGKFDDVIECLDGSLVQATKLLHSALNFVKSIHGTDASRASARAADVLANLWLVHVPAVADTADVEDEFSEEEDDDDDNDDAGMANAIVDKDPLYSGGGGAGNHQSANLDRHDSSISRSNSAIATRIPLDGNCIQLVGVWITCLLHMKNVGTLGFKRLSALLYKHRHHDTEVAKLYITLALDMPPFMSPEDLCDGMKQFQDLLKGLGFKSIPIAPLVELLEFVHHHYPSRLFAGYYGASIYNVCHDQLRQVGDAIPRLKSPSSSGTDSFVELANYLAEAACRLRLALEPCETLTHLADYVTTYARGILQCITSQGTRVPQFCSSSNDTPVNTDTQDGDKKPYDDYHVYHTFWLNCSLLDFFTVANECVTNASSEMTCLVDMCCLWATGSLIWAHDNMGFAPNFGLVARLLEFFLECNMLDAGMLTLEVSPETLMRKSLEETKWNLKCAHVEQCNAYLCGVQASTVVPILPASSALLLLVDVVENLQEHSEWVVSCVDKYMKFLCRVQNLHPAYVFGLVSKLWSSPLLGDMYKYSEMYCKYLEHPGVLGLPHSFMSSMLDTHLPSKFRGDAFINLKALYDSATERGDANTCCESTLSETTESIHMQQQQQQQQNSPRTVDLGARIRSMYLALAFGPVMYRHLMDIFRHNVEPIDLCTSLNAWLTALSSCERLMLKCHSRAYALAKWLLNATPRLAHCEWETLRSEIELGVRLQCSNMYWWLNDLDVDQATFEYGSINRSGVCALLERIIELCSTDDEIPFQTTELLYKLGRLFPGEVNLATILHYKRHGYGDDQSSGLGLKKLAYYCRNEVTRRLILSELEHCEKIKTDSLQLHVNNEYNKIIATTSTREVTIKVEIKIPPTFPMEPSSFTLCDDAFRFRAKLQRLLMLAQSETNASGIAQGILLWQSNLVRFFEGISECTICFSIVHVQFHTIPGKVCKVCKHKFHGECLYKWFRNAPKPKCPLCQSTGSFSL